MLESDDVLTFGALPYNPEYFKWMPSTADKPLRGHQPAVYSALGRTLYPRNLLYTQSMASTLGIDPYPEGKQWWPFARMINGPSSGKRAAVSNLHPQGTKAPVTDLVPHFRTLFQGH